MKLLEAISIIDKKDEKQGFLVSFERAENGLLISDYVPDVFCGELPFETERSAWKFAKKFAKKTVGWCVNIYVVKSKTFAPVDGYEKKKIVNM